MNIDPQYRFCLDCPKPQRLAVWRSGGYTLADDVPDCESFAEVATAVPHGVICLPSGLQFHEITTQVPWKTWLAIERGKRIPAAGQISQRIIKLSGDVFTEEIEEHRQDGVTIRVYSPAKTVADCFKFRNRIGMDVARRVLIDTLDSKKATRDEIWQYAPICRMAPIMRPFLEMVKCPQEHCPVDPPTAAEHL